MLYSAAFSDSWHVLILIIAELFFLFLFFFFLSSGVVLWCDGPFSASTMAVPQQDTGSSSVCLNTTEYFLGLHVCKTDLFFAYL